MKKINIFFILSVIAPLFLLWSCTEENDALDKKALDSGISFKEKDFNFSSAVVYQLSDENKTSSTFKLIASDQLMEGSEINNEKQLNALFLELSTGSSAELSEGFYTFHQGKADTLTKGITYGMALLDGNQAVGIIGGSVDVKKEEGIYKVTFNLITENEEKLEGVLDYNLIVEEKKESNESARTAASCAGCTDNYLKWVSEVEARSWAARFAPFVKFDQEASTFPDDVEVIWNASTNKECGQRMVLSDRSIIESRNLNFTTYFDVQISPTDNRRVFIDYWWAYARQPNCMGDAGGHDYDWEHVVIQFNRNSWNPSTITFFQHAGWYTQNLTVDRDEVFVGKVAHGSYHDSGGFGGCMYYADYRNPGPTVDVSKKLYQLRCSNPILASDVNWGSPGKSPLWRSRDYWNYDPCKGSSTFGTNGCARGDYKDTKLGGIVRGF